MYLTSGANVRTIRFRSWGSFVSRYCFHSASVSSWEMRFRLLGSSFIGSWGSFGRGGSRVDRPEGSRPLAAPDNLRRGQDERAAADDRDDPSLGDLSKWHSGCPARPTTHPTRAGAPPSESTRARRHASRPAT